MIHIILGQNMHLVTSQFNPYVYVCQWGC